MSSDALEPTQARLFAALDQFRVLIHLFSPIAMKTSELAVLNSDDAPGQAAADAATKINACLKQKNGCNVVFSAGAGQTGFLEALMSDESVAWSKVTGFQLDELSGLEADNAHSKRHFLSENVAKLDHFAAFHFINGGAESTLELERLNELVKSNPIDLVFVGLGESGQLGLNDPPNLKCENAFDLVNLSEPCRAQQAVECGFDSAKDMPKSAITMGLQQLMRCDRIIVVAIGKAKAVSAKNIAEGTPSIRNPSAFLQKHPDAVIYLDTEAAALLKSEIDKKNPSVMGGGGGGGRGGGFILRTFRPGQGWVEVGQDQRTERSLGTGKLTPMEMRKKQMAAKRLAALKKM